MPPSYLSKIDMVTAALRELIMNGELRAGDALRQRDLAQRFQVSPTPVREAMRRLEAEGLLRHSPHSGATVVEVDYGATVENYRIRASLESLAAELAAERATEDDARALREINARLAGLDDPRQINELNRQLHLRMYQIADSPLLLSLVRRLWNSFPLGPQVVRPLDISVQQHDAIIDALGRRDAAEAARLTAEHILHAASYFAESEEQGPDREELAPSPG